MVHLDAHEAALLRPPEDRQADRGGEDFREERDDVDV